MSKAIFYLALTMFIYAINIVEADCNSYLEVRTAGFYHTSKRFRDVYGDVGPTYGVDLSARFCKRYTAWINLDQFSKAKNNKECCKTKINILNTSMGLGYIVPFCNCFNAYIGLGPSFSWTYLKNTTYCKKEKYSRLALGGILKTGVVYEICDLVYADVFIDYLYQPIHLGRHIDIGGIKFGLGLGTRF